MKSLSHLYVFVYVYMFDRNFVIIKIVGFHMERLIFTKKPYMFH